MSLEAAIGRLADIMEENNKLLTEMMKKAPASAKTETADAGEKKTRGRPAKAKEDDGEKTDSDGAVDADELKATLKSVSDWLKAFEGNASDPENEARREALASALKKLGVEKISKITTESDRVRVENWLEKKVAAGRMTPEPETEDAGEGEDEI